MLHSLKLVSTLILGLALYTNIMALPLDPAREKTVRDYMRFLDQAKYDNLITLFTDDGIVDSPRTGAVSAKKFYSSLKGEKLNVSLKDIYTSIQGEDVAAYLEYTTQKKPKAKPTKAIDIFEFAPNSNKLKHLTIIFNAQEYQ